VREERLQCERPHRPDFFSGGQPGGCATFVFVYLFRHNAVTSFVPFPTSHLNQVAFAYGMMWVLLVGTAWLLATTYYGINVSSTHSIIGGIIGFALSYNRNAVLWYQVKYKSATTSCGSKSANGAVKNTACNSGAFPYSGIVPIVVTWFFAPTTTACASASLFFVVRTLVLRSTNSYQRSFLLFPVFVFLTMFICIYFVFTKGAAATFNSDADAGWSDEKSGWVAVVIAAGCAIIAACLLPVMKKRVELMIEVEVQQEKDFMERKAIRAGEKAPPGASWRCIAAVWASSLSARTRRHASW
jgi:phosphate/sulfate permease